MFDTILSEHSRNPGSIVSLAVDAATVGASCTAVRGQAPRAKRPQSRDPGRRDAVGDAARVQQALEAAIRRAQAAERAKADFLAHMSHEFRTPLNAIIGFSSMIQNGLCAGPETTQEYAGAIEAAGRHLLALLSGILELTELDGHNVVLANEALDMAALLQASIDAVRPCALTSGITITIDCPNRLPKLSGDGCRLRQIFDHLLANAVKFTPVGGAIRVSIQRSAGGLAVSIADNGIGMKAEEIARALTALEQVDDPRVRRFSGAGLGLPLAARLVELHGGTLSIASASGSGTTVTVRLPEERLLG